MGFSAFSGLKAWGKLTGECKIGLMLRFKLHWKIHGINPTEYTPYSFPNPSNLLCMHYIQLGKSFDLQTVTLKALFLIYVSVVGADFILFKDFKLRRIWKKCCLSNYKAFVLVLWTCRVVFASTFCASDPVNYKTSCSILTN